MTSERMREARDAEDALLLETGEDARLIAAYYDVIVNRCLARVPGPAGWDVAHAAIVRLLAELQRGKNYSVPYRVVVHNIVTWTIKKHWQRPSLETPFPEDWESAIVEPGYGEIDLAAAFAELPPVQREVCELRYLEGLDADEIAARLGKERNAIYQALHNGKHKLKELINGG